MNLPYLTRQDVIGIVIAIIVLGGLLVAWLMLINSGPTMQGNPGFGPEWECSNPGKGGPVCIKRPAKTENQH